MLMMRRTRLRVEGIRGIFGYFSRANWGMKVATMFIVSVAVANGLLLAVDIKVARASDFYRSYEGGLNQSLISCIKALDDDMRIALILRDVNGMAYDEIAAVLRVPLGTVKSRIARARAQVQERLQQHPDFFRREDAHAE